MTVDQPAPPGRAQHSAGSPADSFLTVANTVVRLFNPELKQDGAVPAGLHEFMLNLHQRWLARAVAEGWAAPYQHDVWTLHLRELPILELKRYLYSRRRTYRGCCRVSLAGAADGSHGTLWCSMQYVPSVATKVIEVVVGADWEGGDFTAGRSYCRGAWPDRLLPVLEPVLMLLDGVPGFEAALRTAASLEAGPEEEIFEGSRNDEEALAVLDRARQALGRHGRVAVE